MVNPTSEKERFLSILTENLSNESKWFLWALTKENSSLHKEQLRDIANEGYREFQSKNGNTDNTSLVPSRHGLDIHTARLEGAGLVSVKKIGQTRLYSLTDLGRELLNYLATKAKQ